MKEESSNKGKSTKRRKRQNITISCDSMPELIDKFGRLENAVINGEICDSHAKVLNALIEFYVSNRGEIKTEEDLLKGNISRKGLANIKISKAVEMIMNFNKSEKIEANKIYISKGVIRGITNANASAVDEYMKENEALLNDHHTKLRITEEHNKKLLSRSNYPVYRVSSSRTVKELYYNLAKKEGLLTLFGLENVDTSK